MPDYVPNDPLGPVREGRACPDDPPFGIWAMVLTDEKWSALKAALDAVRSGTGRPLAEERRTIEGVVWRLRNGARWRSVPAEYGPWWRPAQLHIRWSRTGVWARLFAHLRDAGRPELADVFMDGTVVRAHQKAAGARKKIPCGWMAAR